MPITAIARADGTPTEGFTLPTQQRLLSRRGEDLLSRREKEGGQLLYEIRRLVDMVF